jgi:hypothetical protein
MALGVVTGMVTALLLIAIGQRKTLWSAAMAVEELVDAVFEAIERGDPACRQATNEALAQAIATEGTRPAMTSEQFREWLAQVPDRPHRAVRG